MPQKDGVRKLFRYSDGKLDQFLSMKKVKEGDVRLCMEVHFVPSDTAA